MQKAQKQTDYAQRASIGVFRKEITTKHETNPFVPDDLFRAVQEVLETKGNTIVRTADGVYLVEYRETGPFKESVDGWLPVYVARVTQWTSGGIKESEMEEYQQRQP